MARKMKDSGIEWIKEIPEDWNLKRIQFCLKEINEKNSPIKTEQVLSLVKDKGVMLYEEKGNQGNKAKEDMSQYKIAYPNTLIVNSMNILIGSVGISDYMGCVSPVYYIFKDTEESDLRYINYIFNTREFQKELRKYANGILEIRLRVSSSDIFKRKIPLPDKMEQKRIADFLDEKVFEIDTAIAKTRETIEDYKKYKQAIITDAVSQGISENIELKDTENIHIPVIPTHWNMKKIKYIFYIKKNIAGKEGYNVLSITQKGIKIRDVTNNEGQVAADYSKYQLVEVGDFAMNHMDLLTGWVDVSSYAGVTSPDYRVFNFINKNDYDKKYYLYLMQMCYMNKIFYGLGQGVSNMGRWRLQADKFMNFTVPVPPLSEQKQIAEYLDIKCSEIDKLITKKESLIEDLEAYKKSLIYEYVTGKKEVPESKIIPFPATVNCKDKRFAQAVLLTKILDEFGDFHTGRVKVAKTLYVIENHIGFDFDTETIRKVAGPLDEKFYKAEAVVRHNKWFNVLEQNGATRYFAGKDKQKYLEYYNRYFKDYDTEIQRIIDIFKDLNMNEAELLATAYASWNDAIIKGNNFSKDELVDDIFSWDNSKKRFPKEKWLQTFDELEQKNIVPVGHGKMTIKEKE